MTRTRLFRCLNAIGVCTMIILIGGAFSGVRAGSSGQAIKWKLQSAFPSGSLAYDGLVMRFCKSVNMRSNGKLNIEPYPAGALTKSMELFDVVSRDVIQMALSAGLHHARKVPEGIMEFGLPFSFSGPPLTLAAHKQAWEFFYGYRDGEAMKMLP